MKLALKVKIKVAEADKKRLFETFSAYQFAWQTVSDWSFANKLKTSQMEAHVATYRVVRDKFPTLPANLVQAARTDALAKVKTIKKSKQTITAAPKLKRITLRYDTRTSKIRGNEIGLAACGGHRIKVAFEDYPRLAEFRKQFKMLSPGIFYKDGQFWAVLIFEVPEGIAQSGVSEKSAGMQSSVIGLDLGQRNFVATSEGRLYKSKNLNRHRRKIRFLKRKLQTKGTKSARRKLKTLRGKEKRQSGHAVYCLVKQVIKETQAGVFVVEKLRLPAAKGHGKKAKNRRKYAVPLWEFKRILKYKAAILGKQVVEVNPWMTSQDDCRGLALRDNAGNLTRGKRIGGLYIGIDGKHLNADINAAVNIARKFDTNPSVPKGYEWQADVTQPIACKSLNDAAENLGSASRNLESCNSTAS